MTPRSRNAWFAITDGQGRIWRACWSPKPGCLLLSISNGRRIPRTAYRLTAAQVLDLALTEGAVVGPPVQLYAPFN